MQIEHLVKDFISHSPNFYNDKVLDNIDNKHKNIISEAYKKIPNINFKNFRNWEEQSDLSAPAQLSYLSAKNNGFLREISRYLYHKLFLYNDHKFLVQSLLDDYEVIKLTGALNLLMENPVHKTFGVKDFFSHNQTTFNQRWLRYIYLANKIVDFNLNKDNCVWLDVGSYYGGLQSIVKKYRPNWKIVLVDFHHQLCRSYIYLKIAFTESKHILPDEVNEFNSFEEMPEGSFIYVPVSDYSKISKMNVNLSTNFFSFGEMRKEVFSNYFKSNVFKNSQITYLVNRFISAPFFEKTYDSDLNIIDYLSPKQTIKYFDIFPIHYFFINKRLLFNREFYRNLSSPYFEMVIIK